jgi:hypothetical protein
MIREAYSRLLSQRPNRGDESELHVSDLSDCARAVWARRNGKILLQNNEDTLRKFEMGFDVEDRVGSVLDTLEDYTIERGVVHRLGEAKGHSDFVARHKTDASQDFVCEVKSTTFYPKQVNGKRIRVEPKRSEVQWHYRVQATAYAIEQNIGKVCIVIVCRESGMMGEYWFTTDDLADVVGRELEEKAKLTAIGAPMPPPAPPVESYNWKGESWRCKFCKFSACEENKNPDALEVSP